MSEIAAAFGGPDWRRAQAIMAQVAARSTDAVVGGRVPRRWSAALAG